jgi:hypothetical protein
MTDIKHIIITVHGIRTFGQWQNKFLNLIEDHSPHINVFNYTYGYFSVLAFLIPPLRWLIVKNFRRELLSICEKSPDATIDIIGHSFGTHLIAWAIHSTEPNTRPKIRNIILAGSVLKSNFDWSHLFSSGHIKRVINDCGINDNVLIINQLFVLFTGMAGRLGFQGMTGKNLINRYFIGGHSLYFEDGNVLSEKFMKEHWIPILLENKTPPIIDQRSIPTPLEGLLTTIIQNAELVKFSLYSAILIIPLLIYFNLYKTAEHERIKAEQQLLIAEEAKKTADNLRKEAERQKTELAYSLIDLINKNLKVPFDQYSLTAETKLFFDFSAEKLIDSGIRKDIRIECHVGEFQSAETLDHGLILYTNFNANILKEHEYHRMSHEYAMGLGEKIANTFRDSLIKKGYPSQLIETVSFGMEVPIYPYPKIDNYDEWNEAATKNNRCEIKLITPT